MRTLSFWRAWRVIVIDCLRCRCPSIECWTQNFWIRFWIRIRRLLLHCRCCRRRWSRHCPQWAVTPAPHIVARVVYNFLCAFDLAIVCNKPGVMFSSTSISNFVLHSFALCRVGFIVTVEEIVMEVECILCFYEIELKFRRIRHPIE